MMRKNQEKWNAKHPIIRWKNMLQVCSCLIGFISKQFYLSIKFIYIDAITVQDRCCINIFLFGTYI